MDAGKPNFPERIRHHPAHESLVLCAYDEVRAKYGDSTSSCCCLCLSKFEEGDYVYVCDISSEVGCVFALDTACGSIKAWVVFRGHEHRLYFLERVDPSGSQKCQSCRGYTDEHLLRCAGDGCDYSLHLSCGPLPVDVPYSHSGHELTLALKDSFLDGADPEDTWCDICEERRDPMKFVYRSEDPPFTATIDCILPQIVGALQGDYGEVKLRSVRKHIPGFVQVTAQGSTEQELVEEKSVLDGDAEEVVVEREIETEIADIENDFHGEEEEFINLEGEYALDFLPWEDQGLMQCAFDEVEKRGFAEGFKSVVPFKFSDAAFKQFEKLAITGKINLSPWSLPDIWLQGGEQRFVKVGNNLVPPELVPFYLPVIDKHGDFIAGSPLSPTGKAVFLMLFLMLVQEIQGMLVCEITGDLLVSFQFFLEFIGGKLGFDVQFARDNLEKVACAIYAHKFVKARDDITADLTWEIEQLERDIPEDKRKIEALKEQYRRGKESVFVKQCFAESSTLKWKDAGEFLELDEVE